MRIAHNIDAIKKARQKVRQRLENKQAELKKLNEDVSSAGAVFGFHGKFLIYDKKSFFLFGQFNPARRRIVQLVEWKYFENFIMLCIFISSIILAFQDYSDRENFTMKNYTLDKIQKAFTLIFTIEAILKMVAMGVIVHKNSYFRTLWNIIDFFVVMTGLLEFFSSSDLNLKAIRAMRVLRPMRSLSTIPGLRKLVSALFYSLPEFINIFMFLIFIYVLFSILGLIAFEGNLYYRCRLTEKPINATYWPKDETDTRLCSPEGKLGSYRCSSEKFCGRPSDFDLSLEDDRVFENASINWGINTFDHFGSSLMSVFQVITTDSWTVNMYNLMDSTNSVITAIYFVSIVVVGSFFLLNLILAVILDSFIQIQQLDLLEQLGEGKQVDIGGQDDEDKNDIKKMIQNQVQRKSVRLNQDKRREVVLRRSQQESLAKFNKIRNKQLSQVQQVSEEEEEKKEEIKTEHNEEEEDGTKWNVPDENNKEDQSSQATSLTSFSSDDDTDESQEEEQDWLSDSQTSQRNENQVQHQDSSIGDFQLNVSRFEETKALLPPPSRQDLLQVPNNVKKKGLGLQTGLPQISRRRGVAQKLNVGQLATLAVNSQQDNPDYFFVEQQKRKNQSRALNQEEKDAVILASLMRKLVDQKKEKGLDALQARDQRRRNNVFRDNNQDKAQKIAVMHFQRANQNKFFGICHDIVTNPNFSPLIILFIILNTVVLSLDKHPLSAKEAELFEIINSICSLLFFFEMVIKLIGLGVHSYCQDNQNLFDAIIVFLSFFDFVFLSLKILRSGGSLTALRGFRLLRVFKLARGWKRFQNLLKTIYKTLKDISYFSILLGVFLFIYTILGMEFFAYEAIFDGQNGPKDPEGSFTPQSTFDTFLESFYSVFIVLANDGWSSIFFYHNRATNADYKSYLFFTSLLTMGQWVLLNLFLAILLQNFDEQSLSDVLRQNFYEKKKHRLMLKKEAGQRATRKIEGENVLMRMFSKGKQALDLAIIKLDKTMSSPKKSLPKVRSHRKSSSYMKRQLAENKIFMDKEKAEKRAINFLNEIMNRKNFKNKKKVLDENEIKKKILKLKINHMNQRMQGISLYLFPPESPLRRFCYNLAFSPKFDIFILVVILINCIQIAFENPLNDPKSSLIWVLWIIDLLTTLIFISELIVKVICSGFLFCGEHSYLRSYWNLLDFFIIIISVVNIVFQTGDSFALLKAFRIFKGLKPLRLISKNPGLKVAIQALVQAVPNIINVLIISALFFLIFGIIAISMFKGEYYHCQGDYLEDVQKVLDKWDCVNAGGSFMTYMFFYDNIAQSMTALFHVSTTVGWADVLYTSTSLRGIDQEPKLKVNILNGLLFVFFMIVGCFFTLNLFVGVVISTFNREKERLGKNFLLTDKQKNWLQVKLMLFRSKPIKRTRNEHSSIIRFFCYKIMTHRYIEHVIITAIILNTVFLTLNHYGESQEMTEITNILNEFFVCFFTLEAVIKIIAFGKAYFKDVWNVFDFFVVLGSIAGIFINYFFKFNLGQSASLFRAFRIFRVLRLIKRAKSLRIMFTTLVVTLPALVNVGGLLLLLIFLYSILGVSLFAEVKMQAPLHSHANFQSFGNAYLTLFRMSTGEAWHEIMFGNTRSRSILYQCIDDPTYDDYKENDFKPIGCGPDFGKYYFLSYILIVKLIFLNLFIAIILQGFDETNSQDAQLVNEDLMEHFRQKWADFDPEGSAFIKVYMLNDLLFALGDPLGFSQQKYGANFRAQQKFIHDLNLPVYGDCTYAYQDLIEALALRLMVYEQIKQKHALELGQDGNGKVKSDRVEAMKQAVENEMQSINKNEDGVEALQAIEELEYQRQISKNLQRSSNALTSRQIEAARTIVRNFRKHITMRKAQLERENSIQSSIEREKKRAEENRTIELGKLWLNQSMKQTNLPYKDSLNSNLTNPKPNKFNMAFSQRNLLSAKKPGYVSSRFKGTTIKISLETEQNQKEPTNTPIYQINRSNLFQKQEFMKKKGTKKKKKRRAIKAKDSLSEAQTIIDQEIEIAESVVDEFMREQIEEAEQKQKLKKIRKSRSIKQQ